VLANGIHDLRLYQRPQLLGAVVVATPTPTPQRLAAAAAARGHAGRALLRLSRQWRRLEVGLQRRQQLTPHQLLGGVPHQASQPGQGRAAQRAGSGRRKRVRRRRCVPRPSRTRTDVTVAAAPARPLGPAAAGAAASALGARGSSGGGLGFGSCRCGRHQLGRRAAPPGAKLL
jgi:hypothetical protein